MKSLLYVVALFACLPAVVMADPATQPTTQPTTQPAANPAIVGLKNVGGFVFSWVPDQAGGVAHVDAVDLQKNVIADPTLGYTWNFGDPGGAYNVLGAGWNAAHLYDKPGTYAVTLTVKDAAASRAFTAPLTIKPDARRVVHAKTAAEVVAAVKGGNVRVLVTGGTKYVFSGSQTIDISRTRNVTVESEGTGQAVFSLAATPTCFAYWATTNSLIRNIRFQGDPSVLENFLGQKFSEKWMGWIRGDSSSVVGCTFANVLEGIQTQPGCRFMYFADNRADNAFSIWNTALWAEGNNLVCIGNTFPGSPWENPLRLADEGVQRGLIAFTTITESIYPSPDPRHPTPYLHKATFTFRTVKDLYVYKCTSNDSFMGFEPRSVDRECRNIKVEGNTFNNSMLIFRAPVKWAVVTGNTFNEYCGGPGLSADLVRNGTTVEGVQTFGNTFNFITHRPALGYEAPDPEDMTDPTKYRMDLSVYSEHGNTYNVITKRDPAPPATRPSH